MRQWLERCRASPSDWPRGQAVALGIAIGVAIGAATDSVGVWLAIGVAMGASFERRKAK